MSERDYNKRYFLDLRDDTDYSVENPDKYTDAPTMYQRISGYLNRNLFRDPRKPDFQEPVSYDEAEEVKRRWFDSKRATGTALAPQDILNEMRSERKKNLKQFYNNERE